MSYRASPQPLTVTIPRSQATDTFIDIFTGDPNALLVAGGGVTIPTEDTSGHRAVTDHGCSGTGQPWFQTSCAIRSVGIPAASVSYAW
jgi:hypothetical protein